MASKEKVEISTMHQGRREAIVLVLATIVVLMFVAPVIPSKGVGYRDSSQVAGITSGNPPHIWTSSDPTGIYSGYTFENGTNVMNITTYDRLLRDPYSAICSNSGVKFEGTVVLYTCLPTNTYATATRDGFESVAYWLFGHGGLYFDGRYLWE